MSRLEQIVEDLKSLPNEKLESAANFILRLKQTKAANNYHGLKTTSGFLSKEEADQWEKAIEDGCEKIDANEW